MMHFEAALVVLADASVGMLSIDATARIPAQHFAAMKTVNLLND
jgi:hypothetical protein